jgi:hypothetical protein
VPGSEPAKFWDIPNPHEIPETVLLGFFSLDFEQGGKSVQRRASFSMLGLVSPNPKYLKVTRATWQSF